MRYVIVLILLVMPATAAADDFDQWYNVQYGRYLDRGGSDRLRGVFSGNFGRLNAAKAQRMAYLQSTRSRKPGSNISVRRLRAAKKRAERAWKREKRLAKRIAENQGRD